MFLSPGSNVINGNNMNTIVKACNPNGGVLPEGVMNASERMVHNTGNVASIIRDIFGNDLKFKNSAIMPLIRPRIGSHKTLLK